MRSNAWYCLDDAAAREGAQFIILSEFTYNMCDIALSGVPSRNIFLFIKAIIVFSCVSRREIGSINAPSYRIVSSAAYYRNRF